MAFLPSAAIPLFIRGTRLLAGGMPSAGFQNTIIVWGETKQAQWNELKFDVIEMLSRRGLYREAEETRRCRLRYMAPYNIELIARNRALKIQI